MTETQDPENGADRAGRWRPPEARQLPELRGKLAAWLKDSGPAFYLEMALRGSQQVFPKAPNRRVAAQRLASEERQRILGAELYWVSAEMTALAKHAGSQLTELELYEHDLPSRSGFMVFAEPIGTLHHEDVAVDIVAVGWGVRRSAITVDTGWADIEVGRDWADGAVWFTFYSDPLGPIQAICGDDPDCHRQWRRSIGPFMPDNELILRLGTREELPTEPGLTTAWGQTVCAAWLLMSQPCAAQTLEDAQRAARRRLAKAGLPTGGVRVIHVRSPQRRASAEERDRQRRPRKHRSWVTGHWRRYHCGPGRTRVERRWISPYLSGPADRPIRGTTEHVRVWDR
ncbi:hypothetical protein J4573_16345 [Actinomadura barringtoniae]|uniref:Uncharacterized protein n=1 Tax=Actinomadura barringtoniae TaxID=1427535 RepID=A0A939T3W0_9ACTN|nr:hypothetical protein [Actinomadura barringtoniae]MBO2448673.1 hypothetical protein [Actinomadura barringtoniae]